MHSEWTDSQHMRRMVASAEAESPLHDGRRMQPTPSAAHHLPSASSAVIGAPSPPVAVLFTGRLPRLPRTAPYNCPFSFTSPWLSSGITAASHHGSPGLSSTAITVFTPLPWHDLTVVFVIIDFLQRFSWLKSPLPPFIPDVTNTNLTPGEASRPARPDAPPRHEPDPFLLLFGLAGLPSQPAGQPCDPGSNTSRQIITPITPCLAVRCFAVAAWPVPCDPSAPMLLYLCSLCDLLGVLVSARPSPLLNYLRRHIGCGPGTLSEVVRVCWRLPLRALPPSAFAALSCILLLHSSMVS